MLKCPEKQHWLQSMCEEEDTIYRNQVVCEIELDQVPKRM